MKFFSPLIFGFFAITIGCVRKPSTDAPIFPKDFNLTMSKDYCLGTCPVYKISINRNGRVSYRGIDNVKIKGHRSWQLNSDQSAKLFQLINTSNYFKIPDIYHPEDTHPEGSGCYIFGTDLPTVIISITFKGKHHSITHQNGCITCKEYNEVWMQKAADCSAHTIDDHNIDSLYSIESSIDIIIGAFVYTGHESK